MRYPLMPTGVEHNNHAPKYEATDDDMRYPLMPTGVEHPFAAVMMPASI